ncbi:hypothetical protein GCK32_005007 [Trichostrongylus colubriformis]|uniref:Uncharacterized protein n=1 Tax=Trichostrongylus colubriformis TaxID=6319 RepID=A0AAN8IKW7_TRICO
MNRYPDYYSLPHQSLFQAVPPNGADPVTHTESSLTPKFTTTTHYAYERNTNEHQPANNFAGATVERKLDEMNNSLLNFLAQYRLHEEKTTTIEGLLTKILERLPEKEQGPPIDYKFVSYEEVMQLYDTYSTNPRAFVRALEILTYKDQIHELSTAVNKRLFSVNRVEFIRKCLFRHFAVPRNLQDDVWRSVRHSLDMRGARLRQMMRTKQITGFRTSTPVSDLLEGLGYFNSTTEKEVV